LTDLLLSGPFHWYATLWPSNGRETFTCVGKLGAKYKNLALMRDPHFPLVLIVTQYGKKYLFRKIQW